MAGRCRLRARRRRRHLRSTIVSETGEPLPDDEVIITVPADMQAGVWANWGAINESDNAFRESLPYRRTGAPTVRC
jgi:hypothetical protein